MRNRLRPLSFAAALLLAAPVFATQTVYLPPRGSTSGPIGFSTVYNSVGDYSRGTGTGGAVLFLVRLTYDDRGFHLRVIPPSSPYPDSKAIDAAVKVFIARHPLNPSNRPNPLDEKKSVPDSPAERPREQILGP